MRWPSTSTRAAWSASRWKPKRSRKNRLILAAPVVDVADERMAEVLEVPADLVGAAGARPGLDERVAATLELLGGDCEAAPGGGGRLAVELVVDLRRTGRRERRGPARRTSSTRRARRRVGREREDDRPRRAAIEPAEQVDGRADEVARAIGGGVVIGGPAAVRGHAARLVTDEDPLVAIQDLHLLEEDAVDRDVRLAGARVARVDARHADPVTEPVGASRDRSRSPANEGFR